MRPNNQVTWPVPAADRRPVWKVLQEEQGAQQQKDRMIRFAAYGVVVAMLAVLFGLAPTQKAEPIESSAQGLQLGGGAS